jgi:8-oxo-dGTP pyrophosphatase MutT (NUDIX family)
MTSRSDFPPDVAEASTERSVARDAETGGISGSPSRRADAAPRPPGWLPEDEFRAIYRRVPRLCVEVVIVDPERRVLLARRDIPPNVGAWHIPGGTVLFGESLADAVRRVARDELSLDMDPVELLGYIEYPSHYENGLDSPVGLAFRTEPTSDTSLAPELPDGCGWFGRLPAGLYAEQREFLAQRLGFATD